MIAPQKKIRYAQYAAQTWQTLDAEVIVEAPVSLTVNGVAWLTLLCTPVHLEALALGFLYNEGVIEKMDEVADVQVCEHGDNVDVWLNHAATRPETWRKTSGCAGGATAVDILAAPNISLSAVNFAVKSEAIGRLVEMLFESQSLYRKTGGVHTSALSDGESILLSAEDIGRHNTLDKIAGLCLLNDVFPQNRILITTGRISSEMVQKAARLGAPILISRTSPSSLSIEMAERYGITLVGYARKDRYNVYARAHRIVS